MNIHDPRHHHQRFSGYLVQNCASGQVPIRERRGKEKVVCIDMGVRGGGYPAIRRMKCHEFLESGLEPGIIRLSGKQPLRTNSMVVFFLNLIYSI